MHFTARKLGPNPDPRHVCLTFVEQEHRSLDSRKASARGQRSMDEWAGVKKTAK